VVDVLSIFFLGCVQLVAVLGGDMHYYPVGVVNFINFMCTVCAPKGHVHTICFQ
jgi:hypothetical protein